MSESAEGSSSGAASVEPDDSAQGDDGSASEETPHAFPDAAQYAVERWVELTDREAPWWALSTGVGLSLQLNEIQQLSTALQEGKVVSGAVDRLLREVHETFVSSERYGATAFPEVQKILRKVLKGKEASELLPGGAALAAVEAAQKHLAEIGVVEKLMADLDAACDQASSLDDLLGVDERITLLDAELAFKGYSREWRSNAALAAREELATESDLIAALKAGIAKAGKRDPSQYEVLIPLRRFKTDGDLVLAGTMVEREEAEDRLAEWSGGADLLGELDEAEVVLRLRDIEARDIDAAAEQARDALARHLSLWDLQGVDFALGDSLLLRDEGQVAGKRQIRKDWVKRPSGLKVYEAAREGNEDEAAIRRITDALDQLAQARSGSHGASLADLWTVSETLFGGLAADKSAEVSDQLAGVAEYLYVRDLLRWLGSKLDPDEVDLEGLDPEGDAPAVWALRCIRERAVSLPEKLVEKERPLEWVRLGQVLRWDQRRPDAKRTCYLGEELEAVRDRVSAVGNRAYLVRNLFLHQGNPERAAAMAVTLPVFSSVLRAVVGHIIRQSRRLQLPLVESQLARLRVQHVADAYAANPRSGPKPLDEFVNLADD